MNWKTAAFEDLNLNELYDLIRIRIEVFAVEQDCSYQDLDGYDQKAWHVMGSDNGTLVAYARLFAPGIKYKHASIGRIVTASSHRSMGIGKALVRQSISECNRLFGPVGITISAQCYLDKFYTELGFETVSDVYLEDGIDHQEMIRRSLIT
ncbi:MAG: GNAT family N-acetyltransferase [Bacteroidetes bacterium]|nr:GNAT family N-acetyltransferase [Bacteroidota bacterium]